jgi:hypothetical protein
MHCCYEYYLNCCTVSISVSVSVLKAHIAAKGDCAEGETDNGIQVLAPTPVPEVAPSPSKTPAAVLSTPREADGQASRLSLGMQEDPGSTDSAPPSVNMRKSMTSLAAADDREGRDKSSNEALQLIVPVLVPVPVESKGIAKATDQDRDSDKDRDRRSDQAAPSEPVLTPRPPVSAPVLSLEPPISPSTHTGTPSTHTVTLLTALGMLGC